MDFIIRWFHNYRVCVVSLCVIPCRMSHLSNAMVLKASLSSRDSHILWVRVVSGSGRPKPILLMPFWVLDRLDYDFRTFAEDMRRLMGLYWEGEDCTPAFLKTRHMLDAFHWFGKYFYFKQWLDNLARLGDNYRLMSTGFFFWSSGFLRVKQFENFTVFSYYDSNILRLCLVGRGNLGRVCSLSSNVRGKDWCEMVRLVCWGVKMKAKSINKTK